jgi:anti-sigma factor RsiW
MTHSSNDGGKPISESDLHGYLDGELSLERRAEVEAYLAAHPDQAVRVTEYGHLTLALHRLFDNDEMPANPEIEALTDDLVRALRRRRTARRLVGMAAAVAVVVSGAGLATGVHDRFRQAEDRFLAFTQQATNAHMLFAGQMPVPTDAETASDTTVVSWLSQRLTGVPVRAPDLRSLGYALSVERILPSADGPAAQLMYENEKGKGPITLFIGKSRDKRQNAFTYVQNDDLSIFYWQEGPFAYSLAGNLGRPDLLALAEAVNVQLTALPPIPKAMVQRRSGESTQAAGKVSAPVEQQPVGAVPDAVPDAGTAAVDSTAGSMVQPVSKKVKTPPAGTITERAPVTSPTATPAGPSGVEDVKPSAAPIPEADGETPKKT